MKVSQRTALADLLELQAGNLMDIWPLIQLWIPELKNVSKEEAGQMLSQWLKYLPSRTKRDARLPLPR